MFCQPSEQPLVASTLCRGADRELLADPTSSDRSVLSDEGSRWCLRNPETPLLRSGAAAPAETDAGSNVPTKRTAQSRDEDQASLHFDRCKHNHSRHRRIRLHAWSPLSTCLPEPQTSCAASPAVRAQCAALPLWAGRPAATQAAGRAPTKAQPPLLTSWCGRVHRLGPLQRQMRGGQHHPRLPGHSASLGTVHLPCQTRRQLQPRRTSTLQRPRGAVHHGSR